MDGILYRGARSPCRASFAGGASAGRSGATGQARPRVSPVQAAGGASCPFMYLVASRSGKNEGLADAEAFKLVRGSVSQLRRGARFVRNRFKAAWQNDNWPPPPVFHGGGGRAGNGAYGYFPSIFFNSSLAAFLSIWLPSGSSGSSCSARHFCNAMRAVL